MKDPIVLRRTDTLSPTDAIYWKDLFYRITKIGTELEVAAPKGVKRAAFEESVRTAFSPSGSFDLLGSSSVLDVKAEHCGIEIRIIGRQPHFRALQDQYDSIMGELLSRGARPRATCGLHFHILTPGLAEPVPEIVLANLWNLIRRYAPGLKFITSCGDRREALCRRRNHNSHLEMVRHSPSALSMAKIKKKLKESQIVPEHQNFFNLEHLGFTEEGNVLPFHLEFRFPDAHLSSSAITSVTFLFLAMLLKSVDLSQYGVIHVGKIAPWRRNIKLLNMLSNNEGPLATSDTSEITEDEIEELRQNAYELLDLLAPIFNRFVDNPSLDVLLTLAERPISLLRCAGYDWEKIESQLNERASLDEVGLDKTDQRLMQRIELGEWGGLPSTENWKWHAARQLFLTPQDLERRLERIKKLRGIQWDARQGTIIFTS